MTGPGIRTPVSQTIGKHSTHLANEPVTYLKYVELISLFLLNT